MFVLSLIYLFASVTLAAELQPASTILHNQDGVFFMSAIPVSQSKALAEGWVESEFPPNAYDYFEKSVKLLTPPKTKVLGLYFRNETNVGINFAINQESLKNVKTDFNKGGFTTWTTTVNSSTIKYHSTLAKYDCNEVGFERMCDSIQYPGVYGQMVEVSLNISKNPGFTRQTCYDATGIHYFANMTTSLAEEDFEPWYFLTDCSGQIFGGGVLAIAERVPEVKDWLWTVRWGTTDITDALIEYPAWLYEYGKSPGFEGLEFWFIDNPQDFKCSSCH